MLVDTQIYRQKGQRMKADAGLGGKLSEYIQTFLAHRTYFSNTFTVYSLAVGPHNHRIRQFRAEQKYCNLVKTIRKK